MSVDQHPGHLVEAIERAIPVRVGVYNLRQEFGVRAPAPSMAIASPSGERTGPRSIPRGFTP